MRCAFTVLASAPLELLLHFTFDEQILPPPMHSRSSLDPKARAERLHRPNPTMESTSNQTGSGGRLVDSTLRHSTVPLTTSTSSPSIQGRRRHLNLGQAISPSSPYSLPSLPNPLPSSPPSSSPTKPRQSGVPSKSSRRDSTRRVPSCFSKTEWESMTISSKKSSLTQTRAQISSSARQRMQFGQNAASTLSTPPLVPSTSLSCPTLSNGVTSKPGHLTLAKPSTLPQSPSRRTWKTTRNSSHSRRPSRHSCAVETCTSSGRGCLKWTWSYGAKWLSTRVSVPSRPSSTARTGHCSENMAAHRTIRRVCHEAAEVFSAEAEEIESSEEGSGKVDRSWPTALSGRALEEYVVKVVQDTSKNWSSMHQDIKNMKPTEIEYINAYLTRTGSRLGVPTPHNDMLVELVRLKRQIPSGSHN